MSELNESFSAVEERQSRSVYTCNEIPWGFEAEKYQIVSVKRWEIYFVLRSIHISGVKL
jgi:hypothetical protein